MEKRLVLFIFFIGSFLFSQNLVDRFRVPVTIKTKIGFGYDSNFLRLSEKDMDSGNAYQHGIISTIDSPIIKPSVQLIYSPILFENHMVNFISSFSYSHYNEILKKSYFISSFSLEFKLKSYSWIKFGMRDVPKFYLRNFIDRDGLSNDYQQCTFSSQKFFGSYSFPILNLKRTWVRTKYEHVNEFYNSYFTEFDLKKDMVQIELNHKMKNNNHIKIAIAHGTADNFTFNNSSLVSTYIDRSYVFENYRLSFNIKKHSYKMINKFGFSNFLQIRKYDLLLAGHDKLYGLNWKHVVDEWKYYLDGKTNFWIDWNFFNDVNVKTSYQYRWRKTENENFGNLEWIVDSKEYDKHEIWLELSFQFITDFLY